MLCITSDVCFLLRTDTGSFFGIERILSTLNYAYFLGFLSLGVTFVIATGGIDFSIGPVMFCCALISGYCFTSHGMPMPVALILSIVIGLIFGIFNGYLVAYWSVRFIHYFYGKYEYFKRCCICIHKDTVCQLAAGDAGWWLV